MTITFNATLLENLEFKKLITNPERLRTYRPLQNATVENIHFLKKGSVEILYSFRNPEDATHTKQSLILPYHQDIIEIRQERNLLIITYEAL